MPKRDNQPTELIVNCCKRTILRPAEVNDAQFILGLRTTPDLNKYLSPVEDNLEKQKEWLELYKQRENAREEFYFIIQSTKGAPLGTIRAYNVQGGSCSVGSWIVNGEAPAYTGIESVLSLYEFVFGSLKIPLLDIDVRKDNKKVIKFHERFGSKYITSDELNQYFTLSRDDYDRTRKRYKKYFA